LPRSVVTAQPAGRWRASATSAQKAAKRASASGVGGRSKVAMPAALGGPDPLLQQQGAWAQALEGRIVRRRHRRLRGRLHPGGPSLRQLYLAWPRQRLKAALACLASSAARAFWPLRAQQSDRNPS
jgi:hypothetical protein